MSCIKNRSLDSSSTFYGFYITFVKCLCCKYGVVAVESCLNVMAVGTTADSGVSRVRLQKCVLINVFLSAQILMLETAYPLWVQSFIINHPLYRVKVLVWQL